MKIRAIATAALLAVSVTVSGLSAGTASAAAAHGGQKWSETDPAGDFTYVFPDGATDTVFARAADIRKVTARSTKKNFTIDVKVTEVNLDPKALLGGWQITAKTKKKTAFAVLGVSETEGQFDQKSCKSARITASTKKDTIRATFPWACVTPKGTRKPVKVTRIEVYNFFSGVNGDTSSAEDQFEVNRTLF